MCIVQDLIYTTLPHFSFLWVKFFSDATTNQPGFVANLQNVDPICGSHISLNVTETVQVKIISVEIPKQFSIILCNEVCQFGPNLWFLIFM